MNVSDVMTLHAECVGPTAMLRDAAQQMKRLDVGALPICEHDRLIGMVTDRNMAIRGVAEGLDPKSATCRQVMTVGVEYCFEDQDLAKAVQLMEQRQIRRLIVLDRKKKPAGIVSLGDIAVRGRDDLLSGEALEQISEPAEMIGA
jgi:CBS domain-containing protein